MESNIINAYLTIDNCNDIVKGIKDKMYLPFNGNISVKNLNSINNVYLLKCTLDSVSINLMFAIMAGQRIDIKDLINQLANDVLGMYKFEIKHKKEVK